MNEEATLLLTDLDSSLDRIAHSDANTSNCWISVGKPLIQAKWDDKDPEVTNDQMAVAEQETPIVLVMKPVGRDAATKKYDILSALLAHGLRQDKHRQRLIMRLMALITTRYNWQRDELTMGQTEIAKLWDVDTRTVKREMAKLRSLGWLVEKRAAARGRVAMHGIALDQIMLDTRTAWDAIGPDFVARVQPSQEQPNVAANVVPLRPAAAPVNDGTLWAEAQSVFHAQDTAGFAAWVEKLSVVDYANGQLTLMAPSRFHATYVSTNLMERLTVILRRIDPSLVKLVVQH